MPDDRARASNEASPARDTKRAGVDSAIGDYAVVGDGRSIALISKAGSVDWLCWPRFDSRPIFASLVDVERGGRFALKPSAPFVSRRYHANSAVLETHYADAGGGAVIVDYMPAGDAADERHARRPLTEVELVRVVRCVRGTVRVDVRYEPRDSFHGERDPRAVALHDAKALGIRARHGRGLLTLRSEARLDVVDGAAVAVGSVTLRAGECARFVVSWAEEAPALLPVLGPALDELEQRTDAWWNAWVSDDDGAHGVDLSRSAITIKLLQLAASGAIVAAATTSLPESLGGDQNWDYRYCWLRDASMTARALFNLGHEDEARAYVSWLAHATRSTQPRLLPFYDVFGRHAPRERELPLSGYRESRPVRVGNEARRQLQLDAIADVVRAAAEMTDRDRGVDSETGALLCDLGEWLAEHGREPDEGIWEPREPRRHHTHSRAAVDGALQLLLLLAQRGYLPHARARARERWELTARVIEAELRVRAWSRSLESFTAEIGGAARVDAALLQLGLLGVVQPDAASMTSTWRAVDARLRAPRGLLYRTESSRFFEGAFLACSFWEAELLARAGNVGGAQRAFDAACDCANDVGLWSEEADVVSGEALGNVPQAFSHVGHVNAALALAHVRGERRA